MPESDEKDHSETVAMCSLKWKRNLIQIERQPFVAVW